VNADGFAVRAPSTVATLPAQVAAYRGTERFTADQLVGEDLATFKIRYREGVTVLNQISFDGRTWDIVGVRPIGRREALEVDTKSRSETANGP
tara:strand:+ start:661 stop:939 length:279 start_codon:yes stop_codon:yes gene_type:complete